MNIDIKAIRDMLDVEATLHDAFPDLCFSGEMHTALINGLPTLLTAYETLEALRWYDSEHEIHCDYNYMLTAYRKEQET